MAAGGSHEGSCEHRRGGAGATYATAAVRFRIAGLLRFLSHAETARLWQRACARAAVPVRYSEGFNPHPRMSLPLPRPVGVESDEELLIIKLCGAPGEGPAPSRTERETALRQSLAGQMPEGMEVRSVALAGAQASFQPQSAEYILPIRGQEGTGPAPRLRERAAAVMDSGRCVVERTAAPGRATRSVDVRPFLQAIRWENGNLIVQHRAGTGGSIRVEEILQLLGLQTQDLAGPIRRTNVVWETTESHNSANAPGWEIRAEDLEDGT